MSQPDINALAPLLDHLSAYGEFYTAERSRAAQLWSPLLVEAGWIMPVTGNAYAAANQYLALPSDLPEIERLRRVCFSIPAYRRYLLVILIEGLVKAGQIDYPDLERWVTRELAQVAAQINMLLDKLENGKSRMVDWTVEQVTTCLAEWHKTHGSFVNWDLVLLGQSGTPDQLFTRVMSHADAFTTPRLTTVSSGLPLAMLPDLELPKDEAGRLVLPQPAPWSTARQSTRSSLPFFDEQGRPLYDAAQPITTVWQDMLAEQPYYRAVLRTAIAAHMSSYSSDSIELHVFDSLDHVSVLLNNRERGLLVDLLPHLVEKLNYRVLNKPSPLQVRRIIEHWITVRALKVKDDQILLQESFRQSLLERRRGARLMRGASQVEQERVKKYLREMA